MLAMDIQGDEEPTGPSVDADDAEERILARRMRIQKRQETQKKYILHFHFVYLLLGSTYFSYYQPNLICHLVLVEISSANHARGSNAV